MGAPWFKIKHLAEESDLVALSANFQLYGDMSDRMMSLSAGLGHQQEIYSIDESFVNLTGIRGDMVERSHKVRSRILQWVGIPCGIGIGETKTLAKLANHIAKTAERKPGVYPDKLAQVCNLATLSKEEFDTVLAATEVGEVWGIGRKISKQLNEGGINTVLDLVRMDLATVRAKWSVVLERTVRELQGMKCIDLEDSPAPKQEIACTRSFGHPVTELSDLNEAITEFASRAAVKLRKQFSKVGQVMVFIRTSPFRKDPQYSRSIVVPLLRPTADSALIVAAALAGLRVIYRSGYKLAKAGVMLVDLKPDTLEQNELNFGDEDSEDRERLMISLDELNDRFGRGTVMLGSAGTKGDKRAFSMKQERKTPRYTTCLADIPTVRA